MVFYFNYGNDLMESLNIDYDLWTKFSYEIGYSLRLQPYLIK